MYNIMSKLISRHFYVTKEEAQSKVDVFYAVSRLTDEEYSNLAALIEEIYPEE